MAARLWTDTLKEARELPGQVHRAREVQHVTLVGLQWAIVLEPVIVIEPAARGRRAVASLKAGQRVRGQKLRPARKALFQAHEQPVVRAMPEVLSNVICPAEHTAVKSFR